MTRIDRLTRSTFDLFAIVKRIVDAKAQFPMFGGTVGCHRHQHRALDAGGTRRACDVERDLIRTRTAEGRSRAKAQGKHMGRLTPEQKKEAIRRRSQGRYA